jgi:hypothetical protein
MKLEVKNYKSNKIKQIFDKKKIFFFFQTENLKSRDFIKIEQKLIQDNFKIHKIKNNLLKTKSIINAVTIIYSNISTAYIDNFNISLAHYLTKVFKFDEDLIFVSIIYGNKLYLPKEILNLTENSVHCVLIMFITSQYKKLVLTLANNNNLCRFSND